MRNLSGKTGLFISEGDSLSAGEGESFFVCPETDPIPFEAGHSGNAAYALKGKRAADPQQKENGRGSGKKKIIEYFCHI